ncbi:phage tail protein [Achromobacter xylosoxidans]
MEQLEQIPIGQQDNDGTGDPLRNGMAKVNANFTKVQTGVDAVELIAANAAQTATEAKTTADAAIPAAQKGMAGGVAPLDASGKVPAAHLPELVDYIPVDEKGAAGGVAPLDAGAKVPVANLPAGTAGGVAPLGADGKVPAVNLPAAEDSIPLSQKGQPGGVATLDTGGKVPEDQLPPIPTGPPAGSVAWWPLRSSIPAGQIPADGQTISRATFPDLAAMVTAGTVPVVSEADWLADPLKRGSYTQGDGSTSIRVPDLNGKSAGAVGAVFLRGDGSLSAGANGVVQRDAQQNITGAMITRSGAGGVGALTSSSGAFQSATKVTGSGIGFIAYATGDGAGDQTTFDASRVARTSTETRPTNVSGVWTIQAFGAVTNPGAADAAQLASDYAALNAAFQSLSGAISFAMVYPNGGSAAAPANITVNSRYVVANPFPGYRVLCQLEIRANGKWGSPGGGFIVNTTGQIMGCYASQYDDGDIVVQTAVTYLTSDSPAATGHPFQPNLSSFTTAPARVKVWRIRGQV